LLGGPSDGRGREMGVRAWGGAWEGEGGREGGVELPGATEGEWGGGNENGSVSENGSGLEVDQG